MIVLFHFSLQYLSAYFPGRGVTVQSFIRGGSKTNSIPLLFRTPFWEKRYPFLGPIIATEKGLHSTYLVNNSWNELIEQYYLRTASITRGKTSILFISFFLYLFIHSFISFSRWTKITDFPVLWYASTGEIPSLYLPEAWKEGYPF